MPSNLTYSSTESFRKVLLARNLKPYSVTGYYSSNVDNVAYEVQLRDIGVNDVDNDILSKDPYVDILYPLNAYGPDGGYNKNTVINNLVNTKSNLGPYDYRDAKLPQLSSKYEKDIPTKNVYSPNGGLQLYSISNGLFNNSTEIKSLFKPYFDPWSFIPSTYSPYSILMSTNPNGDVGQLSQDSFIAKIGAKQLKELLTTTYYYGTKVNLANKNNSIQNGISANSTDLLRGNSNLLNTTFSITVNTDPSVINDNFISRLSGTYIPSSPIPGDYFQDELYTRYPASIAQLSSAVNLGTATGQFNQYIGPKVIRQKSPSEVFLNNTGSGQASQLFRNLDYNKYKPNYNRNILLDVAQGALNVLGVSSDIRVPSNYYVGSSIQDPKYINSPLGEVPFDTFGRDTQAPVYGPDKMAKTFENISTNNINFGLAGLTYVDSGSLDGGFVWSSPKYSNTGYQANIGGDQGSQSVSANRDARINSDLSSNKRFKEDSILDNTQKILNSTPRGGRRLSHAGNAINQLSKVFNDGYKEITKGSKVIKYTDVNGIISGTEYARVFTKDSPYLLYANLQKKDSNIRKFNYSVLDTPYNLNITPTSANVFNGGVTKYMFSIENLAWASSRTVGKTVDDLPDCEKGPNGGRIMWFPPYDISFSEASVPNFTSQPFLGRPEPIYTYTNTNRTGTISWKIVVDHPSIINLLVDKHFKRLTEKQVNDIFDSFFAGALQYDLYELAKQYPTIPTSELQSLQNIVNNNLLTKENAESISNIVNQSNGYKNQFSNVDFNQYKQIAFYFDPNTNPNDISNTDYNTTFSDYLSQKNTFLANNPSNQDAISTFFDNVLPYNGTQIDNLLSDLYTTFESNRNSDGQTLARISIDLTSTQTNSNNSSNYTNSILNYIKTWNNGALSGYVDSQNLVINTSSNDIQTEINPKGNDTNNLTFNCPGIGLLAQNSTNLMACSRVAVNNVNVNIDNKPTLAPRQPNQTNQPTIQQQLKDTITKQYLRSIMNECSYFQLLNEFDPMFYDSMRQKITHFNPAFHSMTPEGLNARLTFLQQCVRPGDTIPTINENGLPEFNAAKNTSFGAPPVLILRVGDFYNTKIIPSNLSIQYEPLLDINPEGIGVQPMIAKITLQFAFIGGSGLKNPIEKLQNALSFNYYANTEMYDERADATEDNQNLATTEDVINIINSDPQALVNTETQTQNGGGTTIGTEVTETAPNNLTLTKGYAITNNGLSGQILYKKPMDDLLTIGQNYITTTYNKIQQITSDYNFQIYTIASQNRNYTTGNTNTFKTNNNLTIFGKPNNISGNFNSIISLIESDIDNVNSMNDLGLNYIRLLYSKKYPTVAIKQIKSNLKYAILLNYNNIINSLNLSIQDITNVQQNLIVLFKKLNCIGGEFDGYITPSKSIVSYNLTGTTEVQPPATGTTLDELINDYDTASVSLNNYYNDLKNSGLVDMIFNPNNITEYSSVFKNYTCCVEPEKRFFTIMCNVFMNNDLFISFINDIITNDIANLKSGGQTIMEFTKQYFELKKQEYRIEYNSELKFVNDFKKNNNYIVNYKTWTPYVKGKERKFNFNNFTPPLCNVDYYIRDIYRYGNTNTDTTTFNLKNILY